MRQSFRPAPNDAVHVEVEKLHPLRVLPPDMVEGSVVQGLRAAHRFGQG